MRTLQIEARSERGVHVSLVSPGGVDTPIYDLAGSYTGRPGHPPPPVSSPERSPDRVVSAPWTSRVATSAPARPTR